MTDHPKIARTDHEILDVIRHRWSPRAFDATQDVSRGDLRRLFEAARWAPSSGNEQPWRFVVVSRTRAPEPFARLVDALTPKNQTWAAAAPVLVLVAVRSTREKNDARNTHAWYDAGSAVAFFTLQATASGLAARQMQGYDAERARAACDVPAPFEPAVIIAVGVAGDPSGLTIDAHREDEHRPRQRRALDEFVFENTWGTPLE